MMERTFAMLVSFCYLLLHVHLMYFIQTCIAKEEVPKAYLFVFGDSIFDSGLKQIHESGMRTGYLPYGFECMWYDKFRFTNGLTVPEMIGHKFQLKGPASFDDMQYFPGYGGVNYASASAGILPETGRALGKNYCMEKQVGFFNETLERFLRPKYMGETQKFPSAEKLSESLSKSIFLINIGSSDYIFNYLQPNDYNSSRQYNGEAFAELLVRKLGNHLEDLYNLGARKIVVFEIGPLGCLLYIINRMKPRGRCAEDANNLASIFNDKLKVKLRELSDKLRGSSFVIARTFHLLKDVTENPFGYGLKETKWPCCLTQENGTGLCKERKPHIASPEEIAKYQSEYPKMFQDGYYCRQSPPPPKSMLSTTSSSKDKPDGYLCEDRGSFLFWDELHLTEAANKIIVDKCFHPSSGGICSPYDIYQLANQG